MSGSSASARRLRAALWVYAIAAFGAWSWQFADLLPAILRLTGIG